MKDLSCWQKPEDACSGTYADENQYSSAAISMVKALIRKWAGRKGFAKVGCGKRNFLTEAAEKEKNIGVAMKGEW